MSAKEFYEQVHGTGDDAENLNKQAILRLMEAYLQHHQEKPSVPENDFHMASNQHPPVSTGGSY